jgi:hypothetical protein
MRVLTSLFHRGWIEAESPLQRALPPGLYRQLREDDQLPPSRPGSVGRVLSELGDLQRWREILYQYPTVFTASLGRPDFAALLATHDPVDGVRGARVDIEVVIERHDERDRPVFLLNGVGVGVDEDDVCDEAAWAAWLRRWVTCAATLRAASRRELPPDVAAIDPDWQHPTIAELIPETWIIYSDGVRDDCSGCPGHRPGSVVTATAGEDA